MKFLEPNIIVVDDKKEEVEGIIQHYNELGLGCKFFNSNLFEGDTYPDKNYSDVNLLFLDLFYSEQPFDAELCANWVQSIVPEKSYYILILWTKDIGKATEVLEQLKKVYRFPFAFLVKSKSQYTSQTGLNFSGLFKDIDEELEKISGLSEVLIWKKGIKASANEVLGNLAKNIYPNSFNNKLKKIIISHGGSHIKTSKDNSRKRFMLFDALDSILVSNAKKNSHEEKISDLDDKTLYNLENMEEPVIDKELNSWFHFKIEKNLSAELIYPGLISEFQENDWKKLYSIHDDEIILKYIAPQIGTNIRVTSIALLLSRPCDIAQNKYGKNLKLLSGLKIVNPIRKDGARKEFKAVSPKPDSIKIYDHLHLNEEESDITFLFDFRYNFSVPESIFKKDFKNIAIFNKELLSEMQVEYSSYSSRLGITQVI